jgi:ribonuclease J
MLNLARPQCFMPIHGETRHLHAHAQLARDVGVPDESIFVLENGRCLEIDESGARIAEHVPSGVVFVDGLAVGDIGQVVLRDRQMLASDGITMIVVAIDSQTGAVVGDVEFVTRGLVLGSDTAGALEGARSRITRVLERTAAEGVTDLAVIKQAFRDGVAQYVWDTPRRRPMIIPVVMEV